MVLLTDTVAGGHQEVQSEFAQPDPGHDVEVVDV